MNDKSTTNTDDLKSRIEKVLSDILSDKYECKVTLTFTKSKGGKANERNAAQGG